MLLAAAVSFLVGLVVAGTRPPAPTSMPLARPEPVLAPLVVPASAPAAVATPSAVDFAAIADAINPAVVSVDTAAQGETRPRARRTSGSTGPREGAGSGFVIDPAGYILTNHHVVAGADRVTVTVSDGRTLRAAVVGVDPVLDVALLHVRTADPLPAAPLGDSDALRVGEWVCAIGNPLGVYAHSITVGVVSFLGRKLWDPALDAFIQIDAALSVGYSGGPLVNSRGEVVGITTAVSAQAANIGFAVPIAHVLGVLPQLRADGRVSRGFIGIGLTAVTPALAHALGLELDRGAIVEDVSPGTPAAAAGLRPYDVVVAADGQPITDDESLVRYVSARPPGTRAALRVWRDGRTREVAVKLRDRPIPEAVQRRTPVGAGWTDNRPLSSDHAPLGLAVRELDENTRTRRRVPDSIQGVLITDVDAAGPARLTGIRINQVLLEINRQPVPSVAAYRAVLGTLAPGEAVVLLVYNPVTGSQSLATMVLDPA